MDALTMQHMSAMPAPTWRWLRMNDTEIEVPEGLERMDGASVEAEDALLDTTESFEAAVAGLQERLDAARGGVQGSDDRACVRAAQRAREDVADLDTPALSRYQRRAALEEAAGDVTAAFETGIGADARAYLGFLAGSTITLATGAGEAKAATVRVEGATGGAAAASIDVVAAPGSTLDLAISLNAEDEDANAAEGTAAGGGCASADGGADAAEPTRARGLIGSALRVFAGANARVNVTVYITADSAFTVLDDAGYVLDEGARVTVRHVVLGGAHTYTGLAADLRGDTARMDIDTRYLASGSESRDFNYVIRQRGRRTISNMDANGVLTGSAKKVLRGTIDLVHGCKGSEGAENETVLLASRGVDNKTVPVILCDEDDVAGNHGATIGHVRPEQLFYLGCRGLSEEAAEALFTAAKLEDAALSAPDAEMRENVLRLGRALIDGFGDIEDEDFEEDAA
ncbi:ABC transporter permease [[Collinsella] massiliensis]|uniref:ABC transporter permease n=2 Tax=[Collinsella] massiliensis TaxID=1232426 RepID=A0A1Y3XSJ0_9ACTN|nr:ABC transporter permease [[Collinsella] massiliensis]